VELLWAMESFGVALRDLSTRAFELVGGCARLVHHFLEDEQSARLKEFAKEGFQSPFPVKEVIPT